MPKKLTTEQFIENARNVHGDRYDYSLVEYVNNRVKVKIICSEHGTFKQTPHDHVKSRSNCPECSGSVKRDTERFIIDARKTHGDSYDYSLVEYKNNKHPVKIICKSHGVFKQEAYTHLSGSMCPKCRHEINASRKCMSTEQFVEKSKRVHGERYDYSDTEYTASSESVVITCREHGAFRQIASTHTSGHGCPKCGDESSAKYRAFTLAEFVSRADKVHNGKYDYSKAQYTSSRRKITIICPKHGDFQKDPDSHLRGSGCGKCIKRNQNRSYVYVLYGEGRCKIGVSAVMRRRLRELREATPFEFSVVGVWYSGDKTLSLTVERLIHNYFSRFASGLSGFHGATEWFDMPPFECCDLITTLLGKPQNEHH